MFGQTNHMLEQFSIRYFIYMWMVIFSHCLYMFHKSQVHINSDDIYNLNDRKKFNGIKILVEIISLYVSILTTVDN